jgi:hypothetical protein
LKKLASQRLIRPARPTLAEVPLAELSSTVMRRNRNRGVSYSNGWYRWNHQNTDAAQPSCCPFAPRDDTLLAMVRTNVAMPAHHFLSSVRLIRVVVAGCCTIAALLPVRVSPAADFSVVAGRRQLFLDDDGIDEMVHVTRTMHRPEKRGAVIRSPQPHKYAQTRSAPMWDPDAEIYKLWVLGIDENLWQSRDGLHWTPGPPTNMRIDMAVIDPLDAQPSRRFKAPLLNQGFAISANGVDWTALDLDKIESGDEGNFSYLPTEGLFIHTVKRGGKFGRAVALATSRDFASWTDLGLVFQSDEIDQERGRDHIRERLADPTFAPPLYQDPSVYNVDVYNMGVFRYEGYYLGMPAMFHATGAVPNYPNTDGFHLIQLACSRDLQHWQRLGDRATFIGPSRLDSGAYDLTQILPPSAPVVREDELWFFYTGLKYRSTFHYRGTYPNGSEEPIPGRDRDVGGVCLAVLRRDGFVSLAAGDEKGTVTTREFTPPDGKLLVNVDALKGELTVELLDESGQVLARSEPIRGDQPRAEVSWSEVSPAELEERIDGHKVRLRFLLQQGRLYSYWFAD